MKNGRHCVEDDDGVKEPIDVANLVMQEALYEAADGDVWRCAGNNERQERLAHVYDDAGNNKGEHDLAESFYEKRLRVILFAVSQ